MADDGKRDETVGLINGDSSQFELEEDSAVGIKGQFETSTFGRDIDEHRIFFIYPFAEFLGTFFLTLFTSGSIITVGSLTFQYDLVELSGGRLLCVAIQNGLVYACLIYTVNSVADIYKRSEPCQKRREKSKYGLQYPVGHFNPIVTFAVCLAGDSPPALAVAYFFSQLFGAVAGVLLVNGVVPNAAKSNLGATVVGENSTVWQAFGMEATVSCMLILCILYFLVHDADKHRSLKTAPPHSRTQPPFEHVAPFVIGLVVISATMVSIQVSGASMNPARSFASALVSGVWSNHIVYWAGPYVGAAVAIVLSLILKNLT